MLAPMVLMGWIIGAIALGSCLDTYARGRRYHASFDTERDASHSLDGSDHLHVVYNLNDLGIRR